MPRRKLIRSDELPYHVTSRSNNKEWFYIPIEDVWEYFLKHLIEGEKRFGVKVEAYILMRNHYHMCLYTPRANIDEFMQFFNQALGKSIARHADRINRIFGAPYRWSLISSEAYYFNVVRYIYQNPVRAGLCENCEDYTFSNFETGPFGKEWRDWINLSISPNENELMRKKLRKYEI